jgi:hypothetical protein
MDLLANSSIIVTVQVQGRRPQGGCSSGSLVWHLVLGGVERSYGAQVSISDTSCDARPYTPVYRPPPPSPPAPKPVPGVTNRSFTPQAAAQISCCTGGWSPVAVANDPGGPDCDLCWPIAREIVNAADKVTDVDCARLGETVAVAVADASANATAAVGAALIGCLVEKSAAWGETMRTAECR